jgi:hypothetical protein
MNRVVVSPCLDLWYWYGQHKLNLPSAGFGSCGPENAKECPCTFYVGFDVSKAWSGTEGKSSLNKLNLSRIHIKLKQMQKPFRL